MFPNEYKIFAQIGDSVSLTCSATGCESPSFSWRTQIDSPLNGKVKNEGTTSMLIMDPVSFGNEHQYLCTVTCKDMKREKAIRVEIYCKYFRQYLILSLFCFKISFLKESVRFSHSVMSNSLRLHGLLHARRPCSSPTCSNSSSLSQR